MWKYVLKRIGLAFLSTFLILTLKNAVKMAALKTNSHKMAEFTISFFVYIIHSFIHSRIIL